MSGTDPAETMETAATDGTSQPHAAGGVSHAWRALRHRNFRLFFGGQTISLIGTWMTRIATGWLVYRLTGSALLLGTVSFAGQIPTFLVAPFAGVWVDRLDRRQVLVWTQALSMLQSLTLAALTLSGHITIPLSADFERDAGHASTPSTCPAASPSWSRWWTTSATCKTPSPSTRPW